MPYKDKEKRKENDRKYRLKNKEKLAKYHKEWGQKNKDKLYKNMSKYKKTDKGIKVGRIANWKKRGLIGDYDEIYKIFLETEKCMKCEIELTTDRYPTDTTRVMDHCHESGEFRMILCNKCNISKEFRAGGLPTV